MNHIKIYSFLILCFAIVGISKAQNVGVGTTSPQNKLHVKGQMRVDTLTSGTLIADSIVLVGTNGLFKKAQYNAVADQSLGSISAFAFSAVPADYLECNGAAVSRTTYAALFAKLGTTYGAGDGSTTFNVPDLRGEFIRGWSNGRAGVDVGRAMGSSQLDQFQGHNVSLQYNASKPYAPGSTYGDYYSAPGSGFTSGIAIGLISDGVNGTPRVGSETRPRNVAMVYAIKAKESVLVPTATSTAVTTAAIANEPWFNVATGTQATANTQSIYQMGQVLVNTATVPTGGTNAKLIVNSAAAGAVQIKDGTEAAGKVLTSDANGVGTWSSLNISSGFINSTLPDLTYPVASVYENQGLSTTLQPGKYLLIVLVYGYANSGPFTEVDFHHISIREGTTSAGAELLHFHDGVRNLYRDYPQYTAILDISTTTTFTVWAYWTKAGILMARSSNKLSWIKLQ